MLSFIPSQSYLPNRASTTDARSHRPSNAALSRAGTSIAPQMSQTASSSGCSTRGEWGVMTSKQSVDEPRARSIKSLDGPFRGATQAVFTRDHELIKQWATERHAAPATGEATGSGPATFKVNDGGAGIRFNFPGSGRSGRSAGRSGSRTSNTTHARSCTTTTRPFRSAADIELSKQKTGKICCRNGK